MRMRRTVVALALVSLVVGISGAEAYAVPPSESVHTSASWAAGTCEVTVTYTWSGFRGRVQPFVEVLDATSIQNTTHIGALTSGRGGSYEWTFTLDAISSSGSTHRINTYGALMTRKGGVPYSGANGPTSYQLCDIPNPNV